MRVLTLSASANVTLTGAAGAATGTVQLGPKSPGEVWLPSIASVGCQESAITSEAQCKIFVGSAPIQPNYVDGTLSGSTGDSTDRVTGKTIYPGTYVWAVWTGGDPGAVAFLNLSGTKQVP